MELRNAYLESAKAAHAGFIECMYAVYAILIELHYLDPHDVVYPPYGVPGKPSLATSELRHLGFTDEVIALLELIPYPSNELMNKYAEQEVGVPIAPDSAVVSYLEGSDIKRLRSARQPFSDGEIGIPAWAFKYTTCGLDIGTNYLYDTRERTIIRWDSQAVFSDFSDQPHRSTVEAKSILLGEIRSLDWLPWRVKHPAAHRMNVYGRPSTKQHLSTLGSTNRYCVIDDEEQSNQPPDSDNALQRQRSRNEHVNRKLLIAKAVQDRYTFKRNIYEQCGWPDNFQGDEFERRCGIVEKEFFEMAKLLGPAGMRIQNFDQGRQLREWYRQKAEAILM